LAEAAVQYLAEELLKAGAFNSKYGCDGGDPTMKTPKQCGVDMSKLSTIEDWMRNEDWSSVL
jgi:hypothetical protein